MKKGNNMEIVFLLVFIFILFVGLVLFYENKIDELNSKLENNKPCTCICTTMSN